MKIKFIFSKAYVSYTHLITLKYMQCCSISVVKSTGGWLSITLLFTSLLIECLKGTYGINCSHLCGHCSDIYHCSIADGTCQTGCKAGYKGPHCQEGIFISLYSNIYIKNTVMRPKVPPVIVISSNIGLGFSKANFLSSLLMFSFLCTKGLFLYDTLHLYLLKHIYCDKDVYVLTGTFGLNVLSITQITCYANTYHSHWTACLIHLHMYVH